MALGYDTLAVLLKSRCQFDVAMVRCRTRTKDIARSPALIEFTYKVARRLAVGIIGGSVLLLGIVMLVTPGPGLVVIPVGLAILGMEFAWARHWLKKVRERISRANAGDHAARAQAHRDRV